MPIPPPGYVTFPGAYDVIFEYHNVTDPTIFWRTTWTIVDNAPPTWPGGILGALQAYVTAMVHSDVLVDKLSVYNWARGRLPYPLGTPLFIQPLSLIGQADGNWPALSTPYTPAGGEVCLRVDKIASGGKNGRNFHRALLGEDDISALSGGRISTVASVAVLQTQHDTIVTNAGLHSFMLPAATTTGLIVMRFSEKTGVVHGYSMLSSMSVIGATTNKLNRKNRK